MNTDLTPIPNNSELTAVAEPSLIALALAWRVVDPVPDRLGQSIDELERLCCEFLTPCPIDHFVVLLDRLFRGTERPPDDQIVLWRERLEAVPEGTLGRAIDRVLDTHVWQTAPKLASVLIEAVEDHAWQEAKFAKARLKILRLRWAEQQRTAAGERVPYNPKVEGVIQAAAYASQRAMVARTNAEQAKAKAERTARAKPSPAEEARINAKARATVGMGD